MNDLLLRYKTGNDSSINKAIVSYIKHLIRKRLVDKVKQLHGLSCCSLESVAWIRFSVTEATEETPEITRDVSTATQTRTSAAFSSVWISVCFLRIKLLESPFSAKTPELNNEGSKFIQMYFFLIVCMMYSNNDKILYRRNQRQQCKSGNICLFKISISYIVKSISVHGETVKWMVFFLR